MMVSYFNIGATCNKDIIVWNHGKTNVEKEISPCVEHKFNDLVNSLEINLITSCGVQENEEDGSAT